MKIVHFGPFAPNQSGMYEAARDMVIADHMNGHDVFFVDVGAMTTDGKKIEPKDGKEDDRAGLNIISAKPDVCNDADILIYHTGVPDNWVVKNQAPIIMILHGRPASCFVVEHNGSKQSYSLMAHLATWPRIKKMVTFWDYHVQFWNHIIPKEKLVCFDAPPVDDNRFSPFGSKYDFAGKQGLLNVVIADTWRDDINTFEVMNAALDVAKKTTDVMFHLFALKNPLPQCWELILQEFRKANALGATWGRRTDMEEVYRAADIVLSPQRIVTRTVAEPLCCGTPVIADSCCPYVPYKTDVRDPRETSRTLMDALHDLRNYPDNVADAVAKCSNAFSLNNYSESMEKIYEEVLG